MLYLLTQHSAWNRKNKPFLLCKCLRGEGVTQNREHVCRMIPHEEQILLHDRSSRRWESKRQRTPTYTVKEHMKWIDDHNEGVSHFGIGPILLPRDGIRFDTFHMKCSVSKKLMGWLRNFILGQSSVVVQDFSVNILKMFWNDFHIYVWQNKKNFSSFLGNEVALFVGNSNLIIEFLQRRFIPTNETRAFIEALRLWKKMFKFLSITYINSDSYPNKMNEFFNNVKESTM